MYTELIKGLQNELITRGSKIRVLYIEDNDKDSVVTVMLPETICVGQNICVSLIEIYLDRNTIYDVDYTKINFIYSINERLGMLYDSMIKFFEFFIHDNKVKDDIINKINKLHIDINEEELDISIPEPLEIGEDCIDAIWSIVEPTLGKNGYRVLDGDNDAVYISKNGVDYEIKIKKVEDN